jgi:NDP-sugar pyrophosphorylase family protein
MLLAAGEGTRLRPYTNHKPKCMVEIAGKPVLQHNIEWLRRFGVTDFIINLYYMPDAVRDYFGDGSNFGVTITYSAEETLLGTAGGVKKVERFFKGPFFLWYGDNLSNIDLRRLYSFHEKNAAVASIALFYRADPTASGIVGLDDKARITRFLEKPRWDQVFSNWVSAGIFVLNPPVLEFILPDVVSDFGHDVLPAMLANGEPMFGYQMAEDEGLWWIDTPVDLQQVQLDYSKQVLKERKNS